MKWSKKDLNFPFMLILFSFFFARGLFFKILRTAVLEIVNLLVYSFLFFFIYSFNLFNCSFQKNKLNFPDIPWNKLPVSSPELIWVFFMHCYIIYFFKFSIFFFPVYLYVNLTVKRDAIDTWSISIFINKETGLDLNSQKIFHQFNFNEKQRYIILITTKRR